MAEKYVLVSLKDEQAGKIADALSNKSCKKILDLLTEKEASETEIARQLNMPLNTADYNVKKLIKAGLIEEKRYLWSVKGKRIPIYKISNKHLIISPKKKGFSQLKSIFPVVFLSIIFTIFTLWYEKRRIFVQEVAPKAEEFMITRARDFAGEEALETTGFLASISPAEWFLIVLWIGVVIFIVISLRSERRLK